MATGRRTISTCNTTAAAHGILCVALLLACALFPQAVFAQAPPPGVFSEIHSAVVPRTSPALEPATMRSRVVQALIELMIQSANQAFEDSGINPRLVLAHAAKADYVARGTGADFQALIEANDGYMDEVRSLREDFG